MSNVWYEVYKKGENGDADETIMFCKYINIVDVICKCKWNYKYRKIRQKNTWEWTEIK